MKTTELVIGRWQGILPEFGIDQSYLTGKHGPCPICQEGQDRWRFDDKQGKGTFYCSHCGAGTGWKLLELVHGWDFKTAASKIDRIVGNVEKSAPRKKKDPLPRLKRVAQDLVDICECEEVENYLFNRGLKEIPTTLFAHPALEYYEEGKMVGKYPALVGKVLDSQGKPITLHCTYIENGKKVNLTPAKKVLPPLRPLNQGASIRLFDHDETLGVAEGIETAIAAFQRFSIPTWSTIHANGIRWFEVPESVKELIIFADNDSSFTGQSVAYELAKKYAEKISVDVRIPEKVNTDWADYA